MEDSKGTAQRSENDEQLRKRQAEATNPETLSNLESEQRIADSRKASEREVPAPDAQPKEPRQERDDAGPM